MSFRKTTLINKIAETTFIWSQQVLSGWTYLLTGRKLQKDEEEFDWHGQPTALDMEQI